MFANTVESLIERGKALLTVKDQEGVFVAIQNRRAFKLSCRKDAFGIADAKDAAGGIVVGNRNYEFLCSTRFPNKITLEVRQGHGSRVYFAEKLFQRPRIGVFKKAHKCWL